MRTDKTQLLEKYLGKDIIVAYNIAFEINKPSMRYYGKLRAFKARYYEISVTGGTWIAFTDDNILNIWDEPTPYIELKIS